MESDLNPLTLNSILKRTQKINLETYNHYQYVF